MRKLRLRLSRFDSISNFCCLCAFFVSDTNYIRNYLISYFSSAFNLLQSSIMRSTYMVIKHQYLSQSYNASKMAESVPNIQWMLSQEPVKGLKPVNTGSQKHATKTWRILKKFHTQWWLNSNNMQSRHAAEEPQQLGSKIFWTNSYQQ